MVKNLNVFILCNCIWNLVPFFINSCHLSFFLFPKSVQSNLQSICWWLTFDGKKGVKLLSLFFEKSLFLLAAGFGLRTKFLIEWWSFLNSSVLDGLCITRVLQRSFVRVFRFGQIRLITIFESSLACKSSSKVFCYFFSLNGIILFHDIAQKILMPHQSLVADSKKNLVKSNFCLIITRIHPK